MTDFLLTYTFEIQAYLQPTIHMASLQGLSLLILKEKSALYYNE